MINLSNLLIYLLPFGCIIHLLFSLDKGSKQRKMYILYCFLTIILGGIIYFIFAFLKNMGFFTDSNLGESVFILVYLGIIMGSVYVIYEGKVDGSIYWYWVCVFLFVLPVISFEVYDNFPSVKKNKEEQRLKAEEQYIKQNEVISERDNLYSITLTSTINENDYYLVNIISADKINVQKLDIKSADICLCMERDEQPYMETFIKGSGTNNEHIEKIELHIPKEDNEKFKIY